MRILLALSLLLLLSVGASAQSGEDVVGGNKPVTWLGLDFTKTVFVGPAAQFKDAGEITGDQVRDKYVPAWNQLFIDESKKYDVAKAIKRESVRYVTEITANANANVGAGFFRDDPSAYQHLSEADIRKAVRSYDFKGNTGIGMVIFVEGMSKSREEAAGWITFIDMTSKSVLRTFRSTGKAGGFGFRNYWAKAFLNILKDADRR